MNGPENWVWRFCYNRFLLHNLVLFMDSVVAKYNRDTANRLQNLFNFRRNSPFAGVNLNPC